MEVVPTKWLHDTKKKCYWPPWKSTTKLQAAVKGRVDHNSEYEVHSVRVLCETGKFLNYREA